MDLGDFFSPVAKTASRAVTFFTNPIQTIAGATQNFVRGAVGSPFLQGKSKESTDFAAAYKNSKVSIQNAPFGQTVLNSIKGVGGAVGGVFDTITNKLFKVKQKAEIQGKLSEVGGRLIDAGTDAVADFIRSLGSGFAGNREDGPIPARITTGRFSSSQNNAELAQSPGLIPSIIFSPVTNEGPGGTYGTSFIPSIEPERRDVAAPNLTPILLIGGLGLAAWVLLRRGSLAR